MRFLRLPAVKALTGHRADASVYNAIRVGLFPTGVLIGERAKAWPDYEVHAVNAARVAGKGPAEIRQLVVELHAKRSQPAVGAAQP